jgi:hypothetical protein
VLNRAQLKTPLIFADTINALASRACGCEGHRMDVCRANSAMTTHLARVKNRGGNLLGSH